MTGVDHKKAQRRGETRPQRTRDITRVEMSLRRYSDQDKSGDKMEVKTKDRIRGDMRQRREHEKGMTEVRAQKGGEERWRRDHGENMTAVRRQTGGCEERRGETAVCGSHPSLVVSATPASSCTVLGL